MGKAIEVVALERSHTIGLKIGSANRDQFTAANLQECDVAIEFTTPDSAAENIRLCINAGLPVVSGSTGWLDQLGGIEELCKQKDGTFLYASNFSIGVNLFFELNRKLAELMSRRKDYDVTIEETHHTQKKDAPSGTAITLAEQILKENKNKNGWSLPENSTKDSLLITAKRTDPVPGTHRIVYSSPLDDIEIVHTAHNRTGFAMGAVLAAEYAVKHKGVLTMKDVLGMQ